MRMRKNGPWILSGFFILFLLWSLANDFEPGIRAGENALSFVKEMAGILPAAFVLVGLFEVWVKKETVEKHLGEDSGIKGYLWAVVLAGTIVGGLYIALPLCYVLQRKGASLGVIFMFLNAAAVCRIPMTLFEMSFLGLKFTLVRYAVSLPFLALTACLLDRYLGRKEYQIAEGTR